jgi:pyruvate dehydrogenase E2 component (dihydrolipoamide acetyltransferase)
VGSIGGLHATPVINFPEVAILGMYEIKKRPVVKEINGEDQIVIRPMMYVNITCDHRIVDGAIAAEFLKSLVNNLENPARMAFW